MFRILNFQSYQTQWEGVQDETCLGCFVYILVLPKLLGNFFLSSVLENGRAREPKIQFEISYQSSIKVFPLTTNFQSLEILSATAAQVSSFSNPPIYKLQIQNETIKFNSHLVITQTTDTQWELFFQTLKDVFFDGSIFINILCCFYL